MSFSFNLIDQPWIPCLREDGSSNELSIQDILIQAHKLREIRGDTPLETAALHRLLLAILHRIFDGPKSREKWIELWKGGKGQFEKLPITRYLDRANIYPRFDLFHPQRPFYQAFDPRAGKKSAITLVLQMASGNNATLFDHHTERVGVTLTSAQAARALIASQAFGIGGLSGLPEKFTDAPCAKGTVFFAVGTSLFETLMLNLVRYYEDEPLSQPDADDCPAWEMDDPLIPDRNSPKGYLDYLTWHNRRIWLYPEMSTQGIVVREMSWSPGLRLQSENSDPMKQYIVDENEGIRVLCFQPDRALWRDSAVLLRLGDRNKPPKIVKWIADLAYLPPKVLDATHQYNLMALGLAKNRASLEYMRAENFPLSVEYLTDEGNSNISNLGAMLDLAEKIDKLLNRSAFLLAWLIRSASTPDKNFDETDKGFDEQLRIDSKIASGKNDRSKDREAQQIYQLFSSFGVERMYWSHLEAHFYRMIQDLPSQPDTAKDQWRSHLKRVANAAFQQAISYAGTDLRAQRAIVKAEEQFRFGLAKLLNIQKPDSADGGKTHDTN